MKSCGVPCPRLEADAAKAAAPRILGSRIGVGNATFQIQAKFDKITRKIKNVAINFLSMLSAINKYPNTTIKIRIKYQYTILNRNLPKIFT